MYCSIIALNFLYSLLENRMRNELDIMLWDDNLAIFCHVAGTILSQKEMDHLL